LPCLRRFLRKVIDQTPEIVYGKRYDYKSVDKGDYWILYRRQYEGMPWHKIVKVYKKDYESKVHDWIYYDGSWDRLGVKHVI
jgi:hypothetical protein